MHAHGRFEVKIMPQQADNNAETRGRGISRFLLDKRFHGPLEASGQGEMLASGDGSQENGAYVAMEQVTGRLDGRAGGFMLVHRALMRNGKPAEWTVTVVPGSGSAALVGIEGAMRITIVDGQHYYDVDYTLPGE